MAWLADSGLGFRSWPERNFEKLEEKSEEKGSGVRRQHHPSRLRPCWRLCLPPDFLQSSVLSLPIVARQPIVTPTPLPLFVWSFAWFGATGGGAVSRCPCAPVREDEDGPTTSAASQKSTGAFKTSRGRWRAGGWKSRAEVPRPLSLHRQRSRLFPVVAAIVVRFAKWRGHWSVGGEKEEGGAAGWETRARAKATTRVQEERQSGSANETGGCCRWTRAKERVPVQDERSLSDTARMTRGGEYVPAFEQGGRVPLLRRAPSLVRSKPARNCGVRPRCSKTGQELAEETLNEPALT
ncbi:hypothetical protein GALMADRAFT_278296 [Galerina marginata CBS 339.88]|uniref:Uncharacterized protein n=1 Tax=Galerina marginata (strain CBS 339.88) TaxID=685588 RepID=A0A067TFZ7_GALM3|nr:hypothetical protein GALMADRAFT_278296 [Galerina marginata CBS 339.88]